MGCRGALVMLCVGALLSSCSNGSGNTDAAADTASEAGPSINGCGDADFVDISGMAMPTVTFAGVAYTPKCALIHAGQSVVFSGSFATHPLQPGHSPSNMDSDGSPNNPITSTTAGMTATFAFPTAGDYPFFCAVHFASGMSGVIRVQ